MNETICTTPVFRMSWTNLFSPKKNDLNGKEEFSVVALFPKGCDISVLKKAANAAVIKKWGEDKSKWPPNLKSPFRDQSERKKDGKLPEGYEEGAIFITLKSSNRPTLVDQNLQPIIEPSKIYSGAYACASINAYAYSRTGNMGVAFGLNALQLVKDGPPLSGRPSIESMFKPVAPDVESLSDLF